MTNALERKLNSLEICKHVQERFCCALNDCRGIGRRAARPPDLRAEQSDGTQEHWSAEKILAPEPGRKACWRRVYDAKHLAAHPQQKVTELTFFLRVSGFDAGGNYVFKNPHHIVYNFAMSLKRRNDKRALAVGGDSAATACRSASTKAALALAATAIRRGEPG